MGKEVGHNMILLFDGMRGVGVEDPHRWFGLSAIISVYIVDERTGMQTMRSVCLVEKCGRAWPP